MRKPPPPRQDAPATIALGGTPKKCDSAAALANLSTNEDPSSQSFAPNSKRRRLCKADIGRDDLSDYTFSRYQLGKRIGGGGMGVVYQAQHLHLGKSFAIKFIGSQVLSNPEAAARFIQEFTAVGQLNHPHIISAVDAGTVDGILYYVTELLDGQDLSRWVGHLSSPSIGVACEIIRQCANGLAFAHQRGYLHRDIKPANLFLQSNGVAKILDFGLVKSQNNSDGLTSDGQMLGTVDYFSPEQSEDSRTCTSASDIYSLGATFVFLLSGHPPFADAEFPTAVNKLRAHLLLPPPWLALNKDNVPRALHNLVSAMLAKSPADRPQDCGEVARALMQWSDPDQLQRWLAASEVASSSDRLPAKNSPHSDRSASNRIRNRFRTFACGFIAAVIGLVCLSIVKPPQVSPPNATASIAEQPQVASSEIASPLTEVVTVEKKVQNAKAIRFNASASVGEHATPMSGPSRFSNSENY